VRAFEGLLRCAGPPRSPESPRSVLLARGRSAGEESRRRADATAHVAVAVTYSNCWQRRVALTGDGARSRYPAVTGRGPDGVRGETSVVFQLAWRMVEGRGTGGGRAAGASSTQSGGALRHHDGGGGNGQRGGMGASANAMVEGLEVAGEHAPRQRIKQTWRLRLHLAGRGATTPPAGAAGTVQLLLRPWGRAGICPSTRRRRAPGRLSRRPEAPPTDGRAAHTLLRASRARGRITSRTHMQGRPPSKKTMIPSCRALSN
jgi:hypothetical protein